MNSQFTLHGKANQQFGKIIKWEWNINNNGFIQTSSSDTTITTPPISKISYPCILRITDDDNNIAIDTTQLMIGKWEILDNVFFLRSQQCDLDVSINNTPYVALDDQTYNNKATVIRFNGTKWERVGNRAFSEHPIVQNNSNGTNTIAVSLSNDTPYVAFCDTSNNSKTIRCMKYSGTSWQEIGSGFILQKPFNGISLTIFKGIPYIACKADSLNHYEYDCYVLKINGTTWETIGTFSYKSWKSQPLIFKLKKSLNDLYLFSSIDGTASLKKYYNNNWVSVGDDFAYNSNTGHTIDATITEDNTPYISFAEGYNWVGRYLYKFNGSSWIKEVDYNNMGNWLNNVYTHLSSSNNICYTLTILDNKVYPAIAENSKLRIFGTNEGLQVGPVNAFVVKNNIPFILCNTGVHRIY